MPRGGARPGAGRPHGSVTENVRHAIRNEIRNAVIKTPTLLCTNDNGVFQGDRSSFCR